MRESNDKAGPWSLVCGPSLVLRPWSPAAARPKTCGPSTTERTKERTKDQERRPKDSRYIDVESALALAAACASTAPGWFDVLGGLLTSRCRLGTPLLLGA